MLSEEQKCVAIAGACFVLRFLVDPENRQNAQVQMLGYSDAAIFHRWMSLVWTLHEPEARALLTPSQLTLLEEFNAVYESIRWVPVDSHPIMSDTSEGQLNRLAPIATELLKSLESQRRKNI